jgi:hypothetical protein
LVYEPLGTTFGFGMTMIPWSREVAGCEAGLLSRILDQWRVQAI